MCVRRGGWLAALALLCAVTATAQAAPPRKVQPVQRSLKSFAGLPTLQRPAATPQPAPQQVSGPARHAADTAGSQSKVVFQVHDSGYPANYSDRALAGRTLPKAPPADDGRQTARAPGPIRQVAAEEESGLGLTPEPSFRREFKAIYEIQPYYDYSPDSALRRCENLCPRPEGADCPDCLSDSEEFSTENCPQCPPETKLSQLAQRGSVVPPIGNRPFGQVNYCWEPSNLYHLPVYFEDFCLERYGHTRSIFVQPVFSGGLFATQLLGLPYQMTIDPICKKRYVLGWHRPGSYVPCKYYQIPWNTEAAIVQGAAVTGGYFLFAPGVSP